MYLTVNCKMFDVVVLVPFAECILVRYKATKPWTIACNERLIA